MQNKNTDSARKAANRNVVKMIKAKYYIRKYFLSKLYNSTDQRCHTYKVAEKTVNKEANMFAIITVPFKSIFF